MSGHYVASVSLYETMGIPAPLNEKWPQSVAVMHPLFSVGIVVREGGGGGGNKR